MYDFPPKTLYNTICTPEAISKHPGSPQWAYDGQIIWIISRTSIKASIEFAYPKNFKPKAIVTPDYGFSEGKVPYPPGTVGAEIEKQMRARI